MAPSAPQGKLCQYGSAGVYFRFRLPAAFGTADEARFVYSRAFSHVSSFVMFRDFSLVFTDPRQRIVENQRKPAKTVNGFGAGGEDRTPTLLITNQPHRLLCYTGL